MPIRYGQSAKGIKPGTAIEGTVSPPEIRCGELDMGWKILAPSNGKPKSKIPKKIGLFITCLGNLINYFQDICFVDVALALRQAYSQESRLKKASITQFCLSSNSFKIAARF